MDEMLKLAYEQGAWQALQDMGFTEKAAEAPKPEATKEAASKEVLQALLAKIKASG